MSEDLIEIKSGFQSHSASDLARRFEYVAERCSMASHV
jgi:hypothetical protein